jgi:hypothetical protein
VVHVETRRRGESAVDAIQPTSVDIEMNVVRLNNLNENQIQTDLQISKIKSLDQLRADNAARGSDTKGFRKWTWMKTFTEPVAAMEAYFEQRNWRSKERKLERNLADLSKAERVIAQRIWEIGREVDWVNEARAVAYRLDSNYAQKEAKSAQNFFGEKFPKEVLRADIEQHYKSLLTAYVACDTLAASEKSTWGNRWNWITAGAVLACLASATKGLFEHHADRVEMLGFMTGAGVAVGIYFYVVISKKRNAFPEYRTLAEGFRTQLFWAIGGMSNLVTDHYILKFRKDLGWLRRALDAATAVQLKACASPKTIASWWVSEQLAYLTGNRIQRKVDEYQRWNQIGNWLMMIGITVGGGAIALLMAQDGSNLDIAIALLLAVVFMKTLTSLGAAALSLNSKRALGDEIKLAVHLKGVYERAHEQIKSQHTLASDDQEWEMFLLALGKEALGENASWLSALLQRKVSWHGK